MGYNHTQKGPWKYLGYLIAVMMVPLIWTVSDEPLAVLLSGGVVLLVLILTEGFSRLTIRDDGDRLGVFFGPPAVWHTHIAYRDIESVEPDRSTFLDGWGVHWVPGRGTTYNVWGFDCACVKTAKRTVRIGSDDVPRLVAFLTAKRYESRTAADGRLHQS